MENLNIIQFKTMVKDTILKEMRSKTLIFILIATTLLIFLAHSLLKMFISNNADSTIVINGANSVSFMFSLLNFWSVIIAGIFGISAVRSDFNDKIIYQYLTFPISRTQYMMSRITGAWLLVFGYYLYAYTLSAVLFSVATHQMALQWTHLIAMALMGLYIFIVIFLSFMFSLFAGKIGSFLLLIVTVFTINAATNTFKTLAFADYAKNMGVFKAIGLVVYLFLPRINFISDLSSKFLYNEPFELNILLEAYHLFATTALLIFIADRIVRKKDF